MTDQEIVKQVVLSSIINYSGGKFKYLMKSIKEAQVQLDNVKMALALNAHVQDLDTVAGSPTEMDKDIERVSTFKSEIEGVIFGLQFCSQRFIKDMLGSRVTVQDPETYSFEYESKFTKFEQKVSRNVTKIGDEDYVDYEHVGGAFDKFLEAKKFLYDPNYEETETIKLINEKAAKIYEKIQRPIAAFFIASVATGIEDTKQMMNFFEDLFKEKQFKDFVNDIETKMDKYKAEFGESTEELLNGLLESSDFQKDVMKVTMIYRTRSVKKMSPMFGELIDKLLASENLDENFEEIKPSEEPPEDLSDFI